MDKSLAGLLHLGWMEQCALNAILSLELLFSAKLQKKLKNKQILKALFIKNFTPH